ncbi:MAG: Fur family transcriptional regulator [Alphaproteobacteria bacterium]|nr:Fur family transcriptional regulator [Alphaproteobacteria bacterium]MCY4319383.1 Fur family transcriptional regulator [Alphaproteobacteria bacterium]
MAEETSIEKLCRERQVRLTGQRRTVARVLSDSADHPDVDTVYRRASQIDANISIATVYRTLKLFEDANVLTRHDFGGGRARYEEAGEHHDHLIDVETGTVQEFYDAELEEMKSRIARRLGFDLVDHRLELYGRRRRG